MKTNPIRASGEPAPLRAEPRWGQYGNRGIGWPGRLNENAAVASSFTPMNQARREDLYQSASNGLAGVLVPWDRPGYFDGSVAS